MASGTEKAYKIVEKEQAVVDGVDISGHWNRMFEQRVIIEYTPDLIQKIASIPGGESFADCCGLPGRCGRKLWPAETLSLCPNRHGPDRGARALALYNLR